MSVSEQAASGARREADGLQAGLLNFLLCLFVLVSLIRHLTRGRARLSRALIADGAKINFRSPPICCCFPWLPEAQPTVFVAPLRQATKRRAPLSDGI